MIKQLINKTAKKIDAQNLFGVTMLINYIVYFFIFDLNSSNITISLLLRGIASAICLPLIFIKYDNENSYKKLYWYIALTYCLPFFFTFMCLMSELSTVWLMNSVSAAFFLIILVKLKIFSILLSIGITSAFIIYKSILNYSIVINPGNVSIQDILATYFAVIVIGSLFTYRREVIETERKKNTNKIQKLNHTLELKVQKRTINLQDALSAKTEFLNNISHEIRTPIHGFTVISEGLVEQWYNLQENKKYNYAVEISNNAKRLQKLLDNLLDLSKLNNHKIKVNFKQIDLNDLLVSIINECMSLYLNKNHIDMTYDSSNKIIVSGDKEKIEQVLRNIFFNAIKFTPNGGSIKANIKIKNNNVYFSLADSGIGIPNEDLLEIFEPFSQSSRTKSNAGGTGLGLSISKQIIDLHGGKIWAENNIKHGATIHFTIPLN